MGMFDNDRSKSDKRFEQILDAIKTKNGSALEKLYSKKAISEAKDMNGSINELFNFVQGNVVSYNDWGGVSAFGGKIMMAPVAIGIPFNQLLMSKPAKRNIVLR